MTITQLSKYALIIRLFFDVTGCIMTLSTIRKVNINTIHKIVILTHNARNIFDLFYFKIGIMAEIGRKIH